MRVSEIRVKRIRVNQGLGVHISQNFLLYSNALNEVGGSIISRL